VGYQLLPQLLREVLIDQAIAEVKCTLREITNACLQYLSINSPLNQHFKPGLRVTATLEKLEDAATTVED